MGYAALMVHAGVDDVAAMLCRLWSDDRSAVALTDGERGSYMRQTGDAALWHLPAHVVRAVRFRLPADHPPVTPLHRVTLRPEHGLRMEAAARS